LADHLRGIGLAHVQVISTRRHPLVYADWLSAPHRPTILIYGHYDVQPVEPVNECRTRPFEPAIRENNIYGRGSSDDKGQMFAHIKAIESYLRTIEELPVNVKCIFEGEEEIGSPHLPSGITGGHQGKGVKAVIPSKATVKFDIRLVPDQDPFEIERLFQSHITRIAPPSVTVSFRTRLRAKPALLDRMHPAMIAAARSYRRSFGAKPVCLRLGGTIPIVRTIQEAMNIPVIPLGFALPGDRPHAPNERFYLPNFFNGIKTCIWFMNEKAAIGSSRTVELGGVKRVIV
jgi:acetylornithine deacetylase/succinyl-diaminopimelate desuccinylase-like protein